MKRRERLACEPIVSLQCNVMTFDQCKPVRTKKAGSGFEWKRKWQVHDKSGMFGWTRAQAGDEANVIGQVPSCSTWTTKSSLKTSLVKCESNKRRKPKHDWFGQFKMKVRTGNDPSFVLAGLIGQSAKKCNVARWWRPMWKRMEIDEIEMKVVIWARKVEPKQLRRWWKDGRRWMQKMNERTERTKKKDEGQKRFVAWMLQAGWIVECVS